MATLDLRELEGMVTFIILYDENSLFYISYTVHAVRRILHKHRALWYAIGIHLPGVEESDLDAIKVEHSTNCEACSKKLADKWLKQVDPPPTRQALDTAIRKAQQIRWSRSIFLLLASSTLVVLMSVAIASYRHLIPPQLLHETLPTNVVMFGREEDMKNLTELWLDNGVQFINVYGPPGWGKSTLVMRFGHQMVEGGTNVVYIEMNDCRDFFVFENHLREKIPQCRDAQDLPNCVGRMFNERGILIILDNTDYHWFESRHNSKLEKFVESLQKHSAVVKVILTSQRDLNWKPLDGFVTYTPQKISNETCSEIFVHKHNDSGLARKVCERLGNMPLPVKLVASRFADSTDLCDEDECIAEWTKFEDAVHFSYKHLNRSTQVCASLLVKFPGSFTLVAVRQILPNQMGGYEATKCLTSLLKYSFLDRREYKLSGDIFLVDLNDRFQFHMLIKEAVEKFLNNDHHFSSSDYNILLIEFGTNFFTYYKPCMFKFWEAMDTVWDISYTPIHEKRTNELETQDKVKVEAEVLSGRLVGMKCFAEHMNVNSLLAFLPASDSATFQTAVSCSQYKWYSPQTLLNIFPFLSNVFIGDHSILTILEDACLNPDYQYGRDNPEETIMAYANLFNSVISSDMPTPVCPSCGESEALIQRMMRCVEKIEQLAHIGGSTTVNATAIFYGTLYHLCICQTRRCHSADSDSLCSRIWEYWLKANLAPLHVNFCDLCTRTSSLGVESCETTYTPLLCRSCNSSMSRGLDSFIARDHNRTVTFIKLAIEEDNEHTPCNNIKKLVGAMILYSIGHGDDSEYDVQYLRDILPDEVHCLPQLYSHFEPFFADLNVTNVRHIVSNNSKIPAASIIKCLQEIIDVFGEHYVTPRANFGWAFPNSTVDYDYFHELWNNFSTVTSFMDYSNGRLVHRTVPVPVNALCLLQYDWNSLLCSLIKVTYL